MLHDPYLYPGTTVLKNRYGITNPDDLQKVERYMTRIRSGERLHQLPMTARGWLAVHKHLMGDLYDWAGQTRKMDMMLVGHKGQILARFAKQTEIKPGLRRVFSELGRRDSNLVGSSIERFAGRAAYYIAEINHLHPFRDGNGRSMRFWLREMAAQAGHRLELKRLDPDRWIEASIASRGPPRDHAPMAGLIRDAITGRAQQLAAPMPRGEGTIEAARLAVQVHLAAATDQAISRVAALTSAQGFSDGSALKADLLKAAGIVKWLGSREDGPMQRLEIIRAAGVRIISMPPMAGMTDLERVLAIGTASNEALLQLPVAELDRARDIVLGPRGGRGPR